jgi:hypothetical protein
MFKIVQKKHNYKQIGGNYQILADLALLQLGSGETANQRDHCDYFPADLL